MSLQPASAQSSAPDDPFVGIDAKTAAYSRARSWSGGRLRIKGPAQVESHCYHVMSRTCGGDIHFDDIEKEALGRLIWKMSEFLGVRVLTYCVMSNHFHILAEVPQQEIWLRRFDGEEGEEALLKHLASFYSRSFMHDLRNDLKDMRRLGNELQVQERLNAFKRRFCDLSIWGKEIKERFGRWYNKRHERRGTLWMDRFKSVLVQDGEALRTMAAYIDLNPVRAKLVDDPKDYRWSGYAEALGGSRRARRGLCRVMNVGVEAWEEAKARDTTSGSASYRMLLYGEGRERTSYQGQVTKKGFSDAESSREVIKDKQGTLTTAELVRHRVRHFSQGLALGSREWVEGLFQSYRDSFGPKRKTGARRLRQSAAGLFALRDLGAVKR